MRTTNRDLLRKKIKGRRAEVAYKSGCSVSLLDKLASDPKRIPPKEEIRIRICETLGVSMSELFPMNKNAA